MCQCMVCGCIWVNYCGIHEGNLLCSYWLCKPPDLRLLDPSCSHIFACDGIGTTVCGRDASAVLRSKSCWDDSPQHWSNCGRKQYLLPGYVGGGGMAVTTTTTQQGYYGNPRIGGVNMNMNAGVNMNMSMGGGANFSMNMGP